MVQQNITYRERRIGDLMMRFTFFYGGPFSQWYHAPMTVDAITYVTAEQYMMYRKAMLFGDTNIARLIMETEDPKRQKKLGRAVVPYDDDEWMEIADSVVYYGNSHKFDQHPALRNQLLMTEGTMLVEASPYDLRWGIGLSSDDARALVQSEWRGENRLGKILTQIREEILCKQ